MPEPAEHYRPWVQVAAFCQTPLLEANGSLSIIRIVDRYTVFGTAPDMPPSSIQINLVVILKSGFMRGKATVSIKIAPPSGQEMAGPEFPVLFEGEERGVQVILPMGLMFQEEGLYWFDLHVDRELFTRIPLRIMYQKVTQAFGLPGMPPGQPSG